MAEHRNADISAVGPDQFTKSDKTAIFDKAIAVLIHQAQVARFCTDEQSAGLVGEINRDHTVGKEIFKDFRRSGSVAVVKPRGLPELFAGEASLQFFDRGGDVSISRNLIRSPTTEKGDLRIFW